MPIRTLPGTDLAYALTVFDDQGKERPEIDGTMLSDTLATRLADPSRPVTDVLLMAHGWQGDVPAAIAQFDRWMGAMAGQSADRAAASAQPGGFAPLIVGLHWPSLPFGDEQVPASAPALLSADSGTRAGADDATNADDDVGTWAARIADTPRARAAIATILAARERGAPSDPPPADVLAAYAVLFEESGLVARGSAAAPGADQDAFDPAAIIVQSRSGATTAAPTTRLLGISDSLKDLLVSPLRQLSFWKMKDRARAFGEDGAHELLARLQIAAPRARFHLMGHSFGCIVASATVAGPAGQPDLPRPVDSLFLVQGALSLWSYAGDIPYAPGTAGYFRRIVDHGLVRGPIVTTRSSHDTAVGRFYPLGAQIKKQLVLGDDFPAYGGIGTFGIQGAGRSVDLPMRAANVAYDFRPGTIYNLEASAIIKDGSGASGAHSDIAHPEVAHAFWSALLGGPPRPFDVAPSLRAAGVLGGGSIGGSVVEASGSAAPAARGAPTMRDARVTRDAPTTRGGPTTRGARSAPEVPPTRSGTARAGATPTHTPPPMPSRSAPPLGRDGPRAAAMPEAMPPPMSMAPPMSMPAAAATMSSGAANAADPFASSATSASPSPSPAASTASRWVNVAFEDQPRDAPLRIGAWYTLAFDVDVEQRNDAIASTAFADGSLFGADDSNDDDVPVTVQLASADVDIADPVRTIRVARSGRSRTKARFDISPLHDGAATITATLHKDGNFLQTIAITFTVGGTQPVTVGATARGRPASAASVLQPRDIGISLSAAAGGYDCVVWGEVAARARLPLQPAYLAAAIDALRHDLMQVVMHQDARGEYAFQSGIDIGDDERAFALKTMARAGALLFQKIFFGPAAGADANAIGNYLRAAASDPAKRLRLQVVAETAPIPWGLLYVGDASANATLDWDLFIGMRHVVEEIPLQTSLAVCDAAIASDPRLAVSVNVNSGIDAQLGIGVIGETTTYWQQAAARCARVGLTSRASSADVVRALADGSTADQIVYFYCHAESAGLADPGGPDASALIFSDAKLTLGDLALDAPTSTALAGKPLVFINACESAELSPAFYDGFVPYFMAKGARGVVGTQCKTPALFAAEWARRFFDRFLDGATLGDVFLDLRREFLQAHGNPLGLLYAVHCDGDTRIAPALA